MSEIAISIENIGKKYRLGEISTGTIVNDLNRWWAKLRGNEDPLGKVGEENDRTTIGKSEYIWALQDINFKVQIGEVIGIIGSNGAGKSTLLKILSEITVPTTGEIKIKGHISSLLEVGTGFHPELTGKENIFLNGAILGMKKAQIRSKLDEIVAFAGIERYINTPVKRYSSGMYVRLAFAVAAHLEPDILIIDEVLAVGDAEFQKKCMKKMKDVSTQDNRTILFVSHNMQAINALCTKAIWLHQGKIKAQGETQSVVNQYLNFSHVQQLKQSWPTVEEAPGNDYIKVLSVEVIPSLIEPLAPIDIRTPLTVRFRFFNGFDQSNLVTGLILYTISGDCIFDVATKPAAYKKGFIEGECQIPGNFLNDGSYYFSISFVRNTTQRILFFEQCLSFDVEDYRENTSHYGRWNGYVRPQFPFSLQPY